MTSVVVADKKRESPIIVAPAAAAAAATAGTGTEQHSWSVYEIHNEYVLDKKYVPGIVVNQEAPVKRVYKATRPSAETISQWEKTYLRRLCQYIPGQTVVRERRVTVDEVVTILNKKRF